MTGVFVGFVCAIFRVFEHPNSRLQNGGEQVQQRSPQEFMKKIAALNGKSAPIIGGWSDCQPPQIRKAFQGLNSQQ